MMWICGINCGIVDLTVELGAELQIWVQNCGFRSRITDLGVKLQI